MSSSKSDAMIRAIVNWKFQSFRIEYVPVSYDRIENIGARRLATVIERMLEEVSFSASDRGGETVAVDAAYVNERVAPLAAKGDLSRFIL